MNLSQVFSSAQDTWLLLGRPGLVGAALCVMCGVLSIPVVLKRLSFAGQGISHSAFGGIGVAAVVGALLAGPGSVVGAGQGGAVELLIVLLFCIGAALLMSRVADRRVSHEDTGIGILLVASMALGGVLVEIARQIAQANGATASSRTWESVLFGSLMLAGDGDVWLAWCVAAGVLAAAWWWRRPLLFWALDETAAPVFGVSAGWLRGLLMVLLSVAVVASMKLAGVVPATALLVLPGATALRLSRRLWVVVGLSLGVALIGLALSLLLAVGVNIQPGPALVLVLTGCYGLALLVTRR